MYIASTSHFLCFLSLNITSFLPSSLLNSYKIIKSPLPYTKFQKSYIPHKHILYFFFPTCTLGNRVYSSQKTCKMVTWLTHLGDENPYVVTSGQWTCLHWTAYTLLAKLYDCAWLYVDCALTVHGCALTVHWLCIDCAWLCFDCALTVHWLCTDVSRLLMHGKVPSLAVYKDGLQGQEMTTNFYLHNQLTARTCIPVTSLVHRPKNPVVFAAKLYRYRLEASRCIVAKLLHRL